MAKDYIKIDQTTTAAKFASELVQAVNSLRATIQYLDRVKAIMDHNNDGTDFAPIEVLFGLATGKGQAVYNLVNGARGSMSGTFQTGDAVNLTNTVG